MARRFETLLSNQDLAAPSAQVIEIALRDSRPDPDSTVTVVGDRYRLDEVIAEGGMGVIYRAWHLLLQRPVAVKLVKGSHLHSEEIVKRFLEEARAGARIESEHAARVLDFGLHERAFPYLVMELLDGVDLRHELVERRRLPIAEAVDRLLQASRAVAEAHDYGIVHRDLKPENLFLTRRDDGLRVVKVLDFGVAKRLGRESFTWTNEHIGSPNYMAPEQVNAPADVDARADVWSLGAILFELCSGRPVFEGKTLPSISSAVLTGPIPRLRDVCQSAPLVVDRVIDRCLRRDPQERYQNASAFLRALESVREVLQQKRKGGGSSPPAGLPAIERSRSATVEVRKESGSVAKPAPEPTRRGRFRVTSRRAGESPSPRLRWRLEPLWRFGNRSPRPPTRDRWCSARPHPEATRHNSTRLRSTSSRWSLRPTTQASSHGPPTRAVSS